VIWRIRQRRVVVVALVLGGVPLDALVVELGTNRNAVYKTMFDARRKLRAALAADGYLDDTPRRPTTGWTALDRFLQCDASDVGCDEAMVLLPFTSSWWPVMPRRSSATPASRRTFGRAVRAGRISTAADRRLRRSRATPSPFSVCTVTGCPGDR